MERLLIPIGIGLGVVSALGVMRPEALIRWIDRYWQEDKVALAVVARLAFGGFLLFVAQECRSPEIVQLLGLVIVVTGIGVAVAGPVRMRMVVGWWVDRSSILTRLWSGIGVVLGVFLVYAAS